MIMECYAGMLIAVSIHFLCPVFQTLKKSGFPQSMTHKTVFITTRITRIENEQKLLEQKMSENRRRTNKLGYGSSLYVCHVGRVIMFRAVTWLLFAE